MPMSFWDRLKGLLDWARRAYWLVGLLISLGVGKAVAHLLNMNGWQTPIWLISSGLILWLLLYLAGRVSASRPKFQTREEWDVMRSRMKTVANQKFQFQEVTLDGIEWVQCDFMHVGLYYDGTEPMALTNCTLDADTLKSIRSHNPAMASWVELLRNLGMLKDTVNFAVQSEPKTE